MRGLAILAAVGLLTTGCSNHRQNVDDCIYRGGEVIELTSPTVWYCRVDGKVVDKWEW